MLNLLYAPSCLEPGRTGCCYLLGSSFAEKKEKKKKKIRGSCRVPRRSQHSWGDPCTGSGNQQTELVIFVPGSPVHLGLG